MRVRGRRSWVVTCALALALLGAVVYVGGQVYVAVLDARPLGLPTIIAEFVGLLASFTLGWYGGDVIIWMLKLRHGDDDEDTGDRE